MKRILGLKIDVDTYAGMRQGVPRLLESLERLGVRGTFYLSMGPDASGLAVLQLLRNPRFLRKMLRSNAPGLYGFKTALYGTLLPSPLIALSFPDLVHRIAAAGHEVQFHAWDHRRWQDGLPRRSEAWIRDWFDKGLRAFEDLTGSRATSFGAPAWLIDDRALRIAGEYGFSYLSCTRAREPFRHAGIDLPEIPSDLPCFEELGVERAGKAVLAALGDGGLHVLPVHAEVEGGIWNRPFLELMGEIKKQSYRCRTLGEIYRELDVAGLPVRKYEPALLPGRATPCAV
ncbi:MAG TPA: polysaccharide deacetylase family protein [Syntrophales bacterium]|jgi:peptidoglycan/xylan/chitin deacetylase (PgdA/CDA1 family)|nr:polysaccharide deacetylase family protein [Syntrophales bacterium]HPC31469.1 polysaccharide deacetylase family protein [Syntrophales bacterium]HRU87605.1 polysaccharide deacetylase family protein [Syntrophales bacterium]